MLRLLAVTVALLAAPSAFAAGTSNGLPSANPYKAGLAYAACMRAHGVPHPDPDRKGNFTLSPKDEAKLRAAGHAKVEAADKACFPLLKKVVSTRPLSEGAKAKARAVLQQVRDCVAGRGFVLGAPVVTNLTRGRAFFGFQGGPSTTPPSKAMTAADHACEKKVGLAQKIDAIVAADRADL